MRRRRSFDIPSRSQQVIVVDWWGRPRPNRRSGKLDLNLEELSAKVEDLVVQELGLVGRRLIPSMRTAKQALAIRPVFEFVPAPSHGRGRRFELPRSTIGVSVPFLNSILSVEVRRLPGSLVTSRAKGKRLKNDGGLGVRRVYWHLRKPDANRRPDCFWDPDATPRALPA